MKNKIFTFALMLTVLACGSLAYATQTIALLSFSGEYVRSDVRGVFTDVRWSEEDSQALTAEIQERLSALNAGYVLASDYKVSQLEAERVGVTNSVDVLADAGRNLGVDYIIFGNVVQVDLRRSHLGSSNENEAQEVYGNLVVDLRIVDTVKRKYVTARKVGETAFERLAEGVDVDPEAFFGHLRAKIAVQMVGHMKDYLNPIQVLEVKNGYAYLDRGVGQELEKGMTLKAYLPSRAQFDEITGAVTSTTEFKAAELRIHKVMENVTEAQILRYTVPLDQTSFCKLSEDVLARD